jgi:maltose alpha-D-glucosyltransferase/alpha-amylase
MMTASLDPRLETALPRLLPAFLPAQRWFGGKARRIDRVGIEDAVALSTAPSRPVVLVVRVEYADGTAERYTLLVRLAAEPPRLPVIGRLEPPGPVLWVVEAAAGADEALALLRGFGTPGVLATLRGGSLRFGEANEDTIAALARASGTAVRPVGHEQSNTSVRLDRTLVFKLFRRLEEGENPELEVGRFLTTRTSFGAIARMRGSLTYGSAAGQTSTMGVLQDWIDNRGDGWSHVLTLLREAPEGAGSANARDRLRRDIRTLGETTAQFHAALAMDASVPAFAPEPVTAEDLRAWEAALRERMSRVMHLVERGIVAWDEDARRLGESLLARRNAGPTRVAAPRPGAFVKIRVHGDYHLGQTLKTEEGFVLIDFEGEPARPLAERRLKQSALKDVAGMIRSFDYAVETVRRELAHSSSPSTTASLPSAESLRDSFLEGYLSSAAARRAAWLPEDPGTLGRWIDFFELDKALYEVEYEINNRPAWVHLPLGGVLRLLRDGA